MHQLSNMRRLFIFFFCIFFKIQFADGQSLLIKISIQNKPINVYSNSYILINKDDLISCNDSIIDTDDFDILYNLTSCKGYYVSKNRLAVYAKACCDSITPDKALDLYVKDKKKFGDLEEYKESENLELNKLSENKSRSFNIQTNTKKIVCLISIWEVNAEYCLCRQKETLDFYVANRNEICQIKRIKELNKIKRKAYKKVKEKIEYIFSKETW